VQENRAFFRRLCLKNFSRMTEPIITPELIQMPERACEPLLGSDDGKWIFESIFAALKNKTVAVAA
jgi:hypothetical protein